MGVADSPMKFSVCVAFAAIAIVAPATASSAWTEFVTYTGPSDAPQMNVQALNLASSRRTGASTTASYVVQDSTQTKDSTKTTVTLNTFIQSKSSDATNSTANKLAVFKLCYEGAVGTSFWPTVKNAYEKSPNDPDAMPPQCSICLTKGWGVNDKAPGFYLPCGCTSTCVDVSGNLKGNFNRMGMARQDGTGALSASSVPTLYPTSAYNGGVSPLQTLNNCSAFLANQMVYDCPAVANYHFVLWPSLIAVLALLYVAYSMAYMQLDMDSLLY